MQKIINSNVMVTVICFIIVFLGLYTNIAGKICYEGVANFDWWSNDIMISDMMYAENYECDKAFLYIVTPAMLFPEDASRAEGVIPQMFLQNETFDHNLYIQYTSNIVVQRYIYRLLNNSLKLTHQELLNILYFLNCVLSAAVITMILLWVRSFTSNFSCIIMAVTLSFLCPYFAMYGKNLYWLMWTMFLPMACMGLVVKNEKILKKSNLKLLLFGTSFFTCLIKLLVCFEFMTSVMIALTIPLFYICFREKYNLKQIFKMIIWPFLGAMLSFICVFGLKVFMLIQQYGSGDVVDIIGNNLGMRLFGTVDSGAEIYGPLNVSILMLYKEFMSFKGIFKITFCGAICLYLMIVAMCYLFHASKIKQDKEFLALLKTTGLSICAPFSWFVMAAPHTTIHNLQCTINWFLPFSILFLVFLMLWIKKMAEIVKGGENG